MCLIKIIPKFVFHSNACHIYTLTVIIIPSNRIFCFLFFILELNNIVIAIILFKLYFHCILALFSIIMYYTLIYLIKKVYDLI